MTFIGVLKIVLIFVIGFTTGSFLITYSALLEEHDKTKKALTEVTAKLFESEARYSELKREIVSGNTMTDKEMRDRYFTHLASDLNKSKDS